MPGAATGAQVKEFDLPEGYQPKRLHWVKIPKFKAAATLFETLNVSENKNAEIDYDLLVKMFCRKEADI